MSAAWLSTFSIDIDCVNNFFPNRTSLVTFASITIFIK